MNIGMPDERIINYYRLCHVRMGERKHLVNTIPEAKLEAIMTRKEMNLFLRKQDGNYVARETVVGGKPERAPIVVI